MRFLAAVVTVVGAFVLLRQSMLRALEPVESTSGYELTSLAQGMNILLVVLDTTPGKSLDLLDPKSAPLLSKYAREGVVFSKAYAAAPWTRPSIASILTGYHPKVHGVREFTAWYNPGIVTLGQMLRLHGYDTAGFVSHWILSQETTFKRGFDSYQLMNPDADPHTVVSSPAVADAAIEFLLGQAEGARSEHFFLFAHFFDPHFTYIHHPEYDKSSWYKGKVHQMFSYQEISQSYESFSAPDFSFLRDRHLEEVSFTEQHVDRLFKALEASPFADNTIVIVAADHGEEFHEHGGLWHGHSMYDEVIRVPLMVWAPSKLKPQVIDRWVSLMDIVPTLVDVRNLASEERFFGQSLFKAPAPEGRWIYSEVGDNSQDPQRSIDAVLREPLKLVVNHREKTSGLFDLRADPGESNNLIANDALSSPFKEELASSTKELERFIGLQPAPKAPLTNVQVKELRSLGYLSETKPLAIPSPSQEKGP